MRSLWILLGAAAVFVAYLVLNHVRAARVLDREEAALVRLPLVARAGVRPEIVEGGYRFSWIEGDGLPALLVARPVDPGRDGVRWFATTDGVGIYEFDAVRFRAPGGRPQTDGLRRHLALKADARAASRPPTGWVLRE